MTCPTFIFFNSADLGYGSLRGIEVSLPSYHFQECILNRIVLTQ